MQGVGGSSPLVFTTETTIFVRKLSFLFSRAFTLFHAAQNTRLSLLWQGRVFLFLVPFCIFFIQQNTPDLAFFSKSGVSLFFENRRNIKTADAQFSITAFYTEPFSVYRCICQLLTCARLNFKVVCKLGVAESAAFPFVEFFGDIG